MALGLCVALALDVPVAAGAVLIGAFALFHGHAHGTEVAETMSGAEYMAGFAACHRVAARNRHRLRAHDAARGAAPGGPRRGRCVRGHRRRSLRRGFVMIPGEMFIKDGEIELNAGRKTVTLTVANTGDRPIQVGSHYHFFETNPALKFDRKKARGMRLDIAAGTAVRFEPGQTREVTLVALAGKRTIYGFRQDVMGKL